MSELGDLLELLHRARDRWTTVRVAIRAWRHHERNMGAWEAWQESSQSKSSTDYALAGDDGAPAQPETSEAIARLWIDGDRVREEREGDHPYLGIRVGRLWWHYDEMNGAISNEDNPDHGSGVGEEYRHLLDPSGISGGVRFEVLGEANVAGRDGIRVAAFPRPTDHPHDDLHLPFGADEHELVVDRERGVLLRLASRFRGEDFYVLQILDIGFDETFDEDLFVFRPPPGERIRLSGERFSMRDVAIEEAQRRAAFTVWIPDALDPGWRMQTHYIAAEERPPTPEAVSIHYWRQDASHQLSIHESSVGGEDPWGGRWERLDRNGEELLVASEPEPRVRIERDGTQITIHSQDMEVEQLLELADLLVPAPSEPPPLTAG